MMTDDLFKDVPLEQPEQNILLQEGAVLLRGFTLPTEKLLEIAIKEIVTLAPLRNMITPSGHKMSVAMTSCGSVGWITGKKSYRYQATDPLTNNPWPKMPMVMQKLAMDAAKEAGFNDFKPDSCLINQYQPGAKLSLHRECRKFS